MLVKALVRNVSKRNEQTEKPFAIVTVETQQPLEILEFRLFGQSMQDGTTSSFINAVGSEVDIPLTLDTYKGFTALKFPMGEVFTFVPVAKTQVHKPILKP
ncbi:MAG: hypothetical protein L3J28_04445 [Candidatus Polarisedimenticolaceae bacterium]|nr:hypothetical protein [Candidatus Polarisedimenticolaceae bacterium]